MRQHGFYYRAPLADWSHPVLEEDGLAARVARRSISGVRLPHEWEGYDTQRVDAFELAHQPQWDTNTYVDATTTTLSFFNTARANLSLGNLVFPYPNSLLVKAVGVYFKTLPSTADEGAAGSFVSVLGDIAQVINNGVLSVKVGKKDYGPFPLYKLSPGCGLYGVISSTGAEVANNIVSFGQLGLPTPEATYTLAMPYVIRAQTLSTWRMDWPAALNLTADLTITLILETIEARPTQ